jgi:hypothetical protein
VRKNGVHDVAAVLQAATGVEVSLLCSMLVETNSLANVLLNPQAHLIHEAEVELCTS